MKMIALAAAGLVAASALTPTPASAQYYGNGYRNHQGWNGNSRHWRGDRRHWRGDRRQWRGDRRWRQRGYTRCHWVRGYYGPQRQCYRVYR